MSDKIGNIGVDPWHGCPHSHYWYAPVNVPITADMQKAMTLNKFKIAFDDCYDVSTNAKAIRRSD